MKYIISLIFFFIFCPTFALANGLDAQLSGRILLDVENNGEAWYVYPDNLKRYYLGRPADAFAVMRELGLGISEKDFANIPQVGMETESDIEISQKLSGKIILQVEKNGEAWYVNPVDLKKYYLGRPDDAFGIMRKLGLGISRKDLAIIHKHTYNESIDRYSSYQYRTQVTTTVGDFFVDIITIDLNNPDLKIITDTATDYDCKSSCPALSLADFVFKHNGFAGMNGSYFDTSNAKRNYYFSTLYRSYDNTMINDDQFKYWTTGPIIAFDINNKFYYFKDSREFPTNGQGDRSQAFLDQYGVKLGALINNKPRLIENKMNTLIEWELDDKQKNEKSLRNALAYKEGVYKGELLLVIARDATVPELADIMKSLEVDYALNLDGGYSSALLYNGEYMLGPGRNIPNAIVFTNK